MNDTNQPTSLKAFIFSLPFGMSEGEMLSAARAKGWPNASLKVIQMYRVARGIRKRPLKKRKRIIKAAPAKAHKPAKTPEAPVSKAAPHTSETAFLELVARLGFDRAEELIKLARKRIFG